MDERNEGHPAPAPRRPGLFRRTLTFLVTVALVLGAVVLVVNYDKLNFDALKRWFAYRNVDRSDSGQADSFHFDGGSSNTFAILDKDLLVCSSTGIRLYSGSGEVYVDKTVVLEQPVVTSNGSLALVYDAGGQSLFVYQNREEVFSLTLDAGLSLLSADANAGGWLAVVSQEAGSKGVATVYDNTFSPRMQISLSTRFIMDAAMSPDNRSVALLTMGLEGGSFESWVELYRLDRTEDNSEPDWTCPLGGSVILDLRWDSSGIWAVGDNALYTVDGSGALTGTYDYSGRYLKSFSLDGSGTAVLLLGKYRAGTSAELAVVDTAGQVRASQAVEEQVLSLSAAGRYISVLTADRLDIYNQDLELYNTLSGTQSAQKALQRDDGSVMLIDNATARLYLPQ